MGNFSGCRPNVDTQLVRTVRTVLLAGGTSLTAFQMKTLPCVLYYRLSIGAEKEKVEEKYKKGPLCGRLRSLLCQNLSGQKCCCNGLHLRVTKNTGIFYGSLDFI